MRTQFLPPIVCLLTLTVPAPAAERVLDAQLHHLRQGPAREWTDFPEQAEAASWNLTFQAQANPAEQTLRLRQQDVKLVWKVLLNGKEIGRLPQDENDQVICLAVPPGLLANGDNVLRIEQAGKGVDDIRVGDFRLDDRPRRDLLREATVDVLVVENGRPMPCRLTILDDQGALMTVGAESGDQLAVRPGVVYTGNGQATFGLPAGRYTIHAGRGFEYGIDTARITLRPGDKLRQDLKLVREVPTPGLVAADTHVHTLTHSGHGDSTLAERMLTLAGEGIELPIATDHNIHVDYEAMAGKLGVRRHFTPVVGNEVTTAVGHFCVFPVPVAAPVPDFNLMDWQGIFDSIDSRTGARVVILNHPRDLHRGYRPFGPKQHNAVTAKNLDGWVLRANAVEVVNSGAMQTDPLQALHDWFAQLNRGLLLTPIGCSDSHDVSRYIVGQGRTYVRVADGDVGRIDLAEAVESIRAGRVQVSLGLLTEIRVNDRYGPGELAPAADTVTVHVRVLGPSWATADKVELFANGQKIQEARISDGQKPGLKWEGEWRLPPLRHDVHLSAVATGPAVRALHWPIAKPYQPTSPQAPYRLIGSTGAVWIDGEGDGRRTSAFEYAQRLLKEHDSLAKLLPALAVYDQAVAVHVAGLLHDQGTNVAAGEVLAAARQAGPQVAAGFQAYFEAWRQCQLARGEAK